MTMIRIFIIWICGALTSWSMKLTLMEGMTLNDFYSQGFYPSHHSKDMIKFYADPLEICVEGRGEIVTIPNCMARFRFSLDGVLLTGRVFEESPTTIDSALPELEQMSQNVDSDIKTGRARTESEENSSSRAWASKSTSFQDQKTGWKFSLVVNRYNKESPREDIFHNRLYISRDFSQPEMRTINDEWISTEQPLKEPKAWRHLPLANRDRGRDPLVRKFGSVP